MNNVEIFSNFIKNILKINNFELEFFGVGKDNITCLVKNEEEDFIIQKIGNITKIQEEIINDVIEFGYKNGILLAGNKFEKRFYKYQDGIYQVMIKLNGKHYDYEEFSIKELEKIAKYLAIFHNMYLKSDFKKYEKGTNYYKDLFHFIELAKKFSREENKHKEVLQKILDLSKGLKPVDGLPKGIIHGDPIWRNFLFDEQKNVLGLIDYEMISFEDLLWDFVDHIRGYLKNYNFQKDDFFRLKKAYETIRPFTKLEEENLENYLKMMVLNTTTRYFLALFKDSGFSNLKIGTTQENIERGFAEFKKVESFFN